MSGYSLVLWDCRLLSLIHISHIAASYAYAGEAGFTGCNYNDLVNAGVIAYINHLFGQEEPRKGELSLSSTKLNAVRDGNIQKTPNITSVSYTHLDVYKRQL